MLTGKKFMGQHCRSGCTHEGALLSAMSYPSWDTPAPGLKLHPHAGRTRVDGAGQARGDSFWPQQHGIHRGVAIERGSAR